MPESFSRGDLSLAGRLVEQGLVSPEQIQDCLRHQADLLARGLAAPDLLQLLVKRGHLDSEDLRRLQSASPSTASRVTLPAEVGAARELPANVVGKYVRTKRLGSGGMGEVWKGWDTQLGRWVALKFLKSDAAGEVARFQREAQTAARLNHPNIASIHDVGESEGRLFIAMQFVDGRTLAAWPRKDRKLLVSMIRDAALAVHFANEQGIVHRDLKPDNLMVEGATRRVYVMDFGLAKQVEDQSRISVSGMVVGTPAYMAPEQATGERDLDRRTDVYGLGATLFELLAGRPPFRAPDPVSLLKKIVEEEPAEPRRLDPSIPRDLETIVLKCLEKDRSRRYASARELADDLARWLEGAAIHAYPPSVFYRLRRYTAKRKAAVIASTAVLLALLAAAGYVTLLRREARGWEREARALADQGRYEDARKLLDRARARIAIDESIYRLCEDKIAAGRARADARIEEDRVFGPLRKRLEALPDDVEGWRRGVELLDEGLSRHAASWDAWMRKGELHEKLGEHKAALEAYRRAARLNPGLGMARYRIGMILMDYSGRHEEARAEFEAAQAVEPDNEHAMIGRARVAVLRGDWALALRLCDEAEPIGKHLADLYFVRGYVRGNGPESLRDGKAAILDFTRALDRNPRLYSALANRGAVRYGMGELREADADLTAALKACPGLFDAWYNRAAVRRAGADFAGAEKDLTQAIRLQPRNALAHAVRSSVRLSLGNLNGALADCEWAIALSPDLPEAYFARGSVRKAAREYEPAIEDFSRAISLNEKFAEAYNERAIANHFLCRHDLAIRDCTRALEINPRFLEALGTRVEAYEELATEEPGRAVEYLKLAERDCLEMLRLAPKDWRFRPAAEAALRRVRNRLGKE
ncbi:MAG: protein kinase [Planctomycetes bacterium]|nr:protein kinase [Planctomycetota bacterium]